FGGRMASHAVLDRDLPAEGLVFCSFPLHMPRKPAIKRAAHLAAIARPMLFLSGTRDELAKRELLEPLVRSLPNAKLHWLETADHGYRVLKRTRTSTESVFDEMARVARAFMTDDRTIASTG
ncbi:MAG TPA: alpha/beta family hydrolase, partial [Gammaproteobacteria bacterium]